MLLLLLFSNRAGETEQRQFIDISVDSEQRTSRTVLSATKTTDIILFCCLFN